MPQGREYDPDGADWLHDFYATNNIGGRGGRLDREARNYWEGEAATKGIDATRATIKATAQNQGISRVSC